ncbi:MAG: GNAT family N-acetyltransferase [archaeon]
MVNSKATNPSLRFVVLNLDNFKLYSDLIEESEKIYPESIRTDIIDYKDIISTSDAIAFVAFVDDEYVGNIIGGNPTEIDMQEVGMKLPVNHQEIIYIYNLIIVPVHQGKGYGVDLMTEFIKHSKKTGYKFITGNFRNNGSYRIAKKFNPVIEAPSNNWEGSGEDFIYCAFDIR